MESHRAFALFVLALPLVALSAQAEEPPPTPTPRPQTLAAYAESITLKRPDLIDSEGRLTISSETIAELARGGSLTEGRIVLGKSASTKTATTSEKSKWQSRVSKQRAVIEKLAHKRARIEKEIDALENGRLTPRVLARMEKAEVDLQFVDGEIHRAKLEFAKIIREARRNGAEPGWFR